MCLLIHQCKPWNHEKAVHGIAMLDLGEDILRRSVRSYSIAAKARALRLPWLRAVVIARD